MRLRRDIKIGIRLQSSLVIGAVVLWCLTLPGCIALSEPGGLRFYHVVWLICPIVALVFFPTLWWSYLHSTRVHGCWVSAATLAIITPVFVYALLWLANHD